MAAGSGYETIQWEYEVQLIAAAMGGRATLRRSDITDAMELRVSYLDRHSVDYIDHELLSQYDRQATLDLLRKYTQDAVNRCRAQISTPAAPVYEKTQGGGWAELRAQKIRYTRPAWNAVISYRPDVPEEPEEPKENEYGELAP